MSEQQFERDVVVVGGCGHVGLPLAVAFADRGLRVGIYDVSQGAVDAVNAGGLPFDEPAAGPWAGGGLRVGIKGGSRGAGGGVNAGVLPFDERGAGPLLERAVAEGR